jgi:hypothetical protein
MNDVERLDVTARERVESECSVQYTTPEISLGYS